MFDGLAHVVAISQPTGLLRLGAAYGKDPGLAATSATQGQRGVQWHQLERGGSSGAGAGLLIAVIPLTWTSKPHSTAPVGDAVNLEADLLAQITDGCCGNKRPGGGNSPPPWPDRWLMAGRTRLGLALKP